MLHQIFFGILLGWGAAIPIGPINLEIIRRNLTFGFIYGTFFGLGACTTDLTYLLLLSLGALAILNHTVILQIVGVAGSLVLAWFGYCALRLKPHDISEKKISPHSFLRHGAEGYFLTLLNPGTFLFWSSISVQIAATLSAAGSPWYAGVGVLIGTVSWVLGLNLFLYYTHHRLPANIMQYFNIVGGVILLGFSIFGLWHVYALHA